MYLSVQVSFYRASNSDEITSPHPTFNSDTAIVLPTTSLTNIFKVLYDNLMHQIDSFEQNGSGWVVQNLVHLDLNVGQYDSLRASSYLEMPSKFRRSFVNVKNKDFKCYLWSVLAHLYPVKDQKHGNPEQVSHYTPYENELDMTGIEYPLKLCDIDKFEAQNPDISISVFVTSNDNLDISPISTTNNVREKHIKLGLLTRENGEAHYFLIKDLSPFVFSQSKHKGKKLICESCLNLFRLKSALDKHKLT